MADLGSIGTSYSFVSVDAAQISTKLPTVFSSATAASSPAVASPDAAQITTRMPVVLVGGDFPALASPDAALIAPSFPLVFHAISLLGGVSDPTSETLYFGGKNVSDGYASPPCLTINHGGRLRFRFPVGVGARTVSVHVKEATAGAARPVFRLLKDPAMGISSTLAATAAVGTGWQLLGPHSFTAPASGVITVELESFTGSNANSNCSWDNIQIT